MRRCVRSSTGVVIGAVTTAALVVVACSSFSEGDRAAGPDAGADADAARDVGMVDPDVLAADASFASPLIVVADGAYGIEATEVTNAQFRTFKASFALDAGAMWTDCRGKQILGPATNCVSSSTGDLQPVTCVDVCDARTYCVSIGRRLCGRIGGGELTRGQERDVTADQWTRACGGAAGTAWPYGQDARPVCNTYESEAGAPRESGSLPGCEGGESGLFDMSGNVAEWEDSCSRGDASATCVLRGGSYKNVTSQGACTSLVAAPAATPFNDVGFRCCSSP